MGWAITVGATLTDDDWLSTDELAAELGITPSAIRNWQTRYGLKPRHGLYRWGDIQTIRKERTMRNAARKAS